MTLATRHPLAPRAKPPTPEEARQRRESMFNLDQSIRQALAEGRAALWKLAAYLDVWDDQVGWSALGYEHLHDWLGDPEIAMTKGRFYDLVGTYRELKRRELEASEMKELEYTKVRTVLPAVRQGRAHLEDAIDDSKQLSQSDLREKYRDPSSVSGQPNTGEPDPPTKPPLPPDSEPTQASDVEADADLAETGDGPESVTEGSYEFDRRKARVALDDAGLHDWEAVPPEGVYPEASANEATVA